MGSWHVLCMTEPLFIRIFNPVLYGRFLAFVTLCVHVLMIGIHALYKCYTCIV